MRWFLLACLITSATWLMIDTKRSATMSHARTVELIKDSISFSNQVQPILMKKCSPCHFPGGKMYARLPFDHDTTIINHNEGILRRIKTGDENLVIKSFIEQTKRDNSE